MKRYIAALLFSVFLAGTSFSDEPEKLDKIVVTPSRLSTSLENSSRSVVFLDQYTLKTASYDAVADSMGSLGGIDIRRRGVEGVQADVNIRGTTFEQNIVLIDGVKVNDPQTGHYSMDLPMTTMDVDRVEVLKGPSSSVYGPNGFGGAVNIITKPPKGIGCVVEADGGGFDYFRGGVSVTYPFAVLNNRFSFEESRSTGYMAETDFNIISITNTSSIDTFAGLYDFFFGYSKKDFGAACFYSNLFPNEEEHTDTRFFKISGLAENGPLKVMPKLFLRRHWDKFALDRNRPGWQTNYHTTYSYGADIACVLENDILDTSYGFELSRDTIDSTSLQTHSMTKDGFYIELSPKVSDRLKLSAGAREDYFSEFGWQCSPSINASYNIGSGLFLRGAIGKAYRVPTFTDLYYNDSGNRGSAGLTPEESWTYEAGADCRLDWTELSVGFFRRDSDNTIDWTRPNANVPWQAANIGSVKTNGFELEFELYPKKIVPGSFAEKASISYTALDSYRKHDYLSKYALDYLKQQAALLCQFDVGGFNNYWVVNYKKRVGSSGYVTVDTKLSKKIVGKGRIGFEAFIEVANLFDVDYSEQSGIQMPGRWIKSGGKIEF